MELRSQDNNNIGMQNSLDYNSAQPTTTNDQETTIIHQTQTLDHPPLYHQPLNHHHQPPPPLHILQPQSPNPDPVLTSSATIVTTSNSLPPPPPSPSPPLRPVIQYGECQKNHAASMGCHVVDGCREFMPSGSEGTPESFKCAACDCHRNFHRKEVEGEAEPPLPLLPPPPPPPQSGANYFHTYNHIKFNSRRPVIHPNHAPAHPPPPQLHHKPPIIAFGGGSGAPAESSSEDLNMYQSNGGAQLGVAPSFSSSKKRFRTKFTQQQKNGMQELAERLGWRIQKQDEEAVQQFCIEMGVKRQVFKVWMHNNKQSMKKKQLSKDQVFSS